MTVLPSPAKVNLYLLVGNKIPETGMHALDSVMAPLGLSDEISLEIVDSESKNTVLEDPKGSAVHSLNCSLSIAGQILDVRFELSIVDELKRVLLFTENLELTYSDLLNADNLIFKTLISFFNHTIDLFPQFKLPQFLNIKLVKRVPMQAGLGGGSSNAANLLKLLINTFGMNFGDSTFTLARTLGDDVLPCLFQEASHYTNGQIVSLRECLLVNKIVSPEIANGEKIKIPVVVLKPDFGIKTAKAFAALGRGILSPISMEELNARSRKALVSISGLLAGGIENAARTNAKPNIVPGLVNDFQEVAERFYPQLHETRQLLFSFEGCFHSMMTGSGSALIGYFIKESFRDGAVAMLRSHLDSSWFCQESYVHI